MSFFSLLDQTMNHREPFDKSKLYQHDLTNAARWGLAGGAVLACYQLGITLMRRNLYPKVTLKDAQEALHLDPIILDAFEKLQCYRDINVYLYASALHNTDRLLLLEEVLVKKEVLPSRDDKVIAFDYFRTAINRLKQLQVTVKKELGLDHGLAVLMIIDKIYSQLQKRLTNVLTVCYEFNPSNLIKQAERAIEEARRNRD